MGPVRAVIFACLAALHRFLVAGGGIGRLARARGLARRDQGSIALEPADKHGETGTGIQLGPNGFHRARSAGSGREGEGNSRLHRSVAARWTRSTVRKSPISGSGKRSGPISAIPTSSSRGLNGTAYCSGLYQPARQFTPHAERGCGLLPGWQRGESNPFSRRMLCWCRVDRRRRPVVFDRAWAGGDGPPKVSGLTIYRSVTWLGRRELTTHHGGRSVEPTPQPPAALYAFCLR